MSTSGPAKDLGFGAAGRPGTGRPGRRMADNAALAELVQGLDNRWAAASVGSMDGEQPRTEDRCVDHGDRWLHRRRRLADAGQFQAYVANHDVRYFIEGERFGPPGHRESGSASEITAWVKQNFTPADVGDATVYDLSAPNTIALILTRGAPPPCCYRRVVCHRARRSECR